MKIILCLLVLRLLVAWGIAEPVPREPRFTIDLAQGRAMEDVLSTGVPFKVISESPDLSTYHLENCSLVFRFPDGVEFDFYAVMYTIAVENGMVRAAEGYGMIMPVDEAYQLVRNAHILSGMPVERLEDWMKEFRSSPNGIAGLSAFRNGTQVGALKPEDVKFSFGLGIRSAISSLYPVSVELEFSFRGDCVAPPGTIFKHIKLDPSQVYDRADEFRELAEEQRAFQEGASKVSAVAKPGPPDSSKSRPDSARVEVGKDSGWLLWLTVVFVGLFIIYFVRCLLKRPRKVG